MKVNLIDFTGKGQQHPATYAARLLIYIKNTRLEQGAVTREKVDNLNAQEVATELDKISCTIRSSWEFVDYTFEVLNVTRAYTHQQVRTRVGISFAQQAQRVIDLSDGFETRVPDTVVRAGKEGVWASCMGMIASVYKDLYEGGIPAQDCRGVIPTNVLTNIIIKMNLRTLADLAGKRDNARAQDEYSEVIREMKTAAKEVHPWIGPFLEPERTRTPALDKIMKRLLGSGSPVDNPEFNDALKEIDMLKGTWG